MEVGCFLTFGTITLSSIFAGDTWSFRRLFLHACKILYCNSSNDRLYTCITRSSIRRKAFPSLLGIGSKSGGGGDWGVTSNVPGMRSVLRLVAPIPTPCPLLQPFDQYAEQVPELALAHPLLHTLACSDPSTCIGTIYSIIAPFPSSCSCFFFSSPPLLLSSFYSFNFFSISRNFLFASSNLCFSLFLFSTLFMCCFLFSSTAKASLSTRGSCLNL